MNPVTSSLADLQRRTQAHVLDPHDAGKPAIEAAVASARGVGADRRLAVYTDAYRLRLLEILGEDYRALAAWLGTDAFNELGIAYIGAHPSDTRSVRWFGRHLGDLLGRHAPEQPLLAELARFEWARGLAFDAADAEPLEMGEIAAVPGESWPRLAFQLAASVQRLDLRFNVPAMFPALLSDQHPEAVEAAAPIAWMLWRHELVVQWRALDPDEAPALDAIASGAGFGHVCELLTVIHGNDEGNNAALRAASMLKRWISDGLIVALRETG